MGTPKDRQEGSPTSREGIAVASINEIANLYELAAQDVNALAGRALLELGDDSERRASQFRLTRAAQLSRMIDERLAVYGRRAGSLLLRDTTGAMDHAMAMARGQLREIGIDPERRVEADGTPVSTFLVGLGTGVDENAVRLLAEDIAQRTAGVAAAEMHAGARRHGDNAVAVFRALGSSDVVARLGQTGGEVAINRAIGRGLIQGDPKVIDRAIRDLFREPTTPGQAGRATQNPIVESVRKLGNKQIQVGGWNGTVRTYAETVTRTRTREATVEARHRRLEASGIDMVQITGAESDNFCTAFIGLVCGLNGSVEINGQVYPGLADTPGGGPPYHPNCSKGTVAFHPELVSPERITEGARALSVYHDRADRGLLTTSLRAA